MEDVYLITASKMESIVQAGPAHHASACGMPGPTCCNLGADACEHILAQSHRGELQRFERNNRFCDVAVNGIPLSLGFLWGFMLGENPELYSRCCLQALTDPGEVVTPGSLSTSAHDTHTPPLRLNTWYEPSVDGGSRLSFHGIPATQSAHGFSTTGRGVTRPPALCSKTYDSLSVREMLDIYHACNFLNGR
ncbi:hypothetical protein E1301_Tti017906 [Triplophysa tibetana]|uniref:Uncharacterized protein n=1 Tax=Triplophysa tibetana TaxID=1572043 RepID=A0A5A9MWZ5_9TELE|nr:hypothetical protein E1301_Tti017906 [Triplophysa tibetana]